MTLNMTKKEMRVAGGKIVAGVMLLFASIWCGLNGLVGSALYIGIGSWELVWLALLYVVKWIHQFLVKPKTKEEEFQLLIEEMVRTGDLVKLERTDCKCNKQCNCDFVSDRLLDQVEQAQAIIKKCPEKEITRNPMTMEERTEQWYKDMQRESEKIVVIHRGQQYSPSPNQQAKVIKTLMPDNWPEVLRTGLAGDIVDHVRLHGNPRPGKEAFCIIVDFDNQTCNLQGTYYLLPPGLPIPTQVPKVSKITNVVRVPLGSEGSKISIFTPTEMLQLDLKSIPSDIIQLFEVRPLSMQSFEPEPPVESLPARVNNFIKGPSHPKREIETPLQELDNTVSSDTEYDTDDLVLYSDDSDTRKIAQKKLTANLITKEEHDKILHGDMLWCQALDDLDNRSVGPSANHSD